MLLCAVGGTTPAVLPTSTKKQVSLTATPIVKCDVDAYAIDYILHKA